jgi:hypothetical protein
MDKYEKDSRNSEREESDYSGVKPKRSRSRTRKRSNYSTDSRGDKGTPRRGRQFPKPNDFKPKSFRATNNYGPSQSELEARLEAAFPGTYYPTDATGYETIVPGTDGGTILYQANAIGFGGSTHWEDFIDGFEQTITDAFTRARSRSIISTVPLTDLRNFLIVAVQNAYIYNTILGLQAIAEDAPQRGLFSIAGSAFASGRVKALMQRVAETLARVGIPAGLMDVFRIHQQPFRLDSSLKSLNVRYMMAGDSRFSFNNTGLTYSAIIRALELIQSSWAQHAQIIGPISELELPYEADPFSYEPTVMDFTQSKDTIQAYTWRNSSPLLPAIQTQGAVSTVIPVPNGDPQFNSFYSFFRGNPHSHHFYFADKTYLENVSNALYRDIKLWTPVALFTDTTLQNEMNNFGFAIPGPWTNIHTWASDGRAIGVVSFESTIQTINLYRARVLTIFPNGTNASPEGPTLGWSGATRYHSVTDGDEGIVYPAYDPMVNAERVLSRMNEWLSMKTGIDIHP